MKGSYLTVLDNDKTIIFITEDDSELNLWENICFKDSNELIRRNGKYEYIKSENNHYIYVTKIPYHYSDVISVITLNNIRFVGHFLCSG